MSVDVVGYSALMAQDATRALAALLTHFREIAGLVRQLGGRVVDAPGDNMLIELPDEPTAIRCAIAVQRRVCALRLPPDMPRLRFRIGLHCGALLDRNGRLYGDPVNLASRLQAAAEPGGILLSEAVAARAPSSVAAGLHSLGPRGYKNMPTMIATYRAQP